MEGGVGFHRRPLLQQVALALLGEHLLAIGNRKIDVMRSSVKPSSFRNRDDGVFP
jgi:hypothetical protein